MIGVRGGVLSFTRGVTFDRVNLRGKGHDGLELVFCGTAWSRTTALDMLASIGRLGKLSREVTGTYPREEPREL